MARPTVVVRDPSHAGSWYNDDTTQLSRELDAWLNEVQSPVTCIGPRSQGQTETVLPVPGARIIIAPHAGYSYSGPTAAWAYRIWDLSKTKRIFLLGPSHHHPLSKAALSRCTHYRTPLGDLEVDQTTTEQLYQTGLFEYMSQSVDEREHSLELHLPYIYSTITRTFGSETQTHPHLIPIMIGNTSSNTETMIGHVLSRYLTDPTSAFVISSDFAHWGKRFGYTQYRTPQGHSLDLTVKSRISEDWPIHKSIEAIDFECIDACESGNHSQWLDVLRTTGNTVCGRHPIGVIMSALAEFRRQEGRTDVGSFRFVKYDRSSEVSKVNESSVSYASAFAVL